jgi:hypothetical protein
LYCSDTNQFASLRLLAWTGAVGKTSLKIVEALALATGRSLLGQDVPKRFGCSTSKTYMTELRRRVSAAMIYYNIKLSGGIAENSFQRRQDRFDPTATLISARTKALLEAAGSVTD